MEMWIEFLSKVAVAGVWAISAYFFIRLFITKFEKHLGRATERLTKIGGIEFSSSAQTSDPASPIVIDTDSSTGKSSSVPDIEGHASSFQIDQQNSVKTWLNGIKPEDREALLIAALANWQINWKYEVINAQIFGSQLTLLSQANAHLVSDSFASLIYENAKKIFTLTYENYNYESWIKWLIVNDLIVRQEERLHITEFGREFFRYIVGRGYSISRVN